jgi:Ca2+-binding RTX toxin-like protein
MSPIAHRNLRARALGAAVAALLAVPAAANAATVDVSGTTVSLSAAGGEANHVTLDGDVNPAIIFITDTGATLTENASACTSLNAHTVRCAISGGPSLVTAGLGDEDDFLSNHRGFKTEVNGGSGADDLFGGSGADELDGDAGADELVGGSGNDDLFGGLGPDRIVGGPGDDELAGSFGHDSLEDRFGTDKLFGGPDSDDLDAFDGAGVVADVVDCGLNMFQRDSANVDDGMDDTAGCEFITSNPLA